MSEDIGELTVSSRLLFVALWCHADREGRIKFQRMALAAQCMPYEMDQFGTCLDQLIEHGHVIMYEVENKKYLYLPTFTKHQRPHGTEKNSELPEFNGELTVNNTLEERELPAGKGKGKGKDISSKIPFEDFWTRYPRKEAKKKSETAWNNLTLTKQKLALEDCGKRYANVDKQFIPLPTSYLNGERWSDDPLPGNVVNHPASDMPRGNVEW